MADFPLLPDPTIGMRRRQESHQSFNSEASDNSVSWRPAAIGEKLGDLLARGIEQNIPEKERLGEKVIRKHRASHDDLRSYFHDAEEPQTRPKTPTARLRMGSNASSLCSKSSAASDTSGGSAPSSPRLGYTRSWDVAPQRNSTAPQQANAAGWQPPHALSGYFGVEEQRVDEPVPSLEEQAATVYVSRRRAEEGGALPNTLRVSRAASPFQQHGSDNSLTSLDNLEVVETHI